MLGQRHCTLFRGQTSVGKHLPSFWNNVTVRLDQVRILGDERESGPPLPNAVTFSVAPTRQSRVILLLLYYCSLQHQRPIPFRCPCSLLHKHLHIQSLACGLTRDRKEESPDPARSKHKHKHKQQLPFSARLSDRRR